MNPLAQELNEMIESENPYVAEMLSTLGREMFFPKGILAQSAEAKAKGKKFNATIGMATEGGGAMFLPSVMAPISGLAPDEAVRYAPVTGLPELREAWQEKNLKDNPTLASKPAKDVVAGKSMSLPIVTNGLTHGLSVAADLFCDPGDALVLPDKIWGNYRLIFRLRHGAEISSYPFYNDGGGFNVSGLRDALRRASKSRVIVLLNFPNNPTGYTPTESESDQIADALIRAADSGTNVVALFDDAYFGLFYEPDVMAESLFTKVAGAHERLLAIKGDAATKELFVWGLRVGFISFSAKGASPDGPLYAALEKKVSGAIRSVISNCSMLSQRVALKALQSATLDAERRRKREILRSRAVEVKRVLADKKYDDAWEIYPFNSGYFMCLKLRSVAAEDVRMHLLENHAVGTIAAGERDLRIAFSCVEKEQIQELFDIIYRAVQEVR